MALFPIVGALPPSASYYPEREAIAVFGEFHTLPAKFREPVITLPPPLPI